MSTAAINVHAQPFSANPGARTGVFLCHGFTGSPASLRPWADFLAGAGLRVELPRLPGHGTRWQELELTEWTDWYRHVEQVWHRLDAECSQVFVAGLSMGGALALRLAEEHPVAGLMLVNPAIASDDISLRLLPHLPLVAGSQAAIGNDIARPGADEHAYPRTPLRPARSMTKLWQLVRRDLGRVDCDLLLMTSRTDHVVDGATARLLRTRLGNQVTSLELARSHHVATLDHDAELIQQVSLDFINGRSAPDHAR